jgi:dipeptide/tripeptide permease
VVISYGCYRLGLESSAQFTIVRVGLSSCLRCLLSSSQSFFSAQFFLSVAMAERFSSFVKVSDGRNISTIVGDSYFESASRQV